MDVEREANISAVLPGYPRPRRRVSFSEDDQRHPILNTHGYKILEILATGSYSIVKLASSERHRCNVAVKIISKRDAPPNYVKKFLSREVGIAKILSLKHPNVILFLQAIETNARVYIVMEEASGGTLLQLIRRVKRIQEKQAAVWFRQMIDAVDFCHKQGVVHRDLKCENLMLDSTNNIKVIDFGFARAEMFPVSGEYRRYSETYCGSYAYSAPEVLIGIPYIPQSADIWSLGVILYVMVIGKIPFDVANHKKLLQLVLKGPTFPDNRESSQKFQQLVTDILQRESSRPGFAQIRKAHWLTQNAFSEH